MTNGANALIERIVHTYLVSIWARAVERTRPRIKLSRMSCEEDARRTPVISFAESAMSTKRAERDKRFLARSHSTFNWRFPKSALKKKWIRLVKKPIGFSKIWIMARLRNEFISLELEVLNG